MGKNNRSKKRLREEKAKVKFKVGKTLPKGQNVTDLTFKTKKIVVPEQLKPAEEGVVLSRRRRKTLKELMTMLTNFNSKARQEALEGLEEISKSDFSEISSNSVAVLSKVAPVCSDKEPKVRKIAVRALRDILARSDLVHLRPSTHALAANLSSSMTHVVPEIRSDSLAILDAILETHPLLLSLASEDQRKRIFQDFLAQISGPLKGEVGAKTAGIDWFVRVLSRLKLFVSGYTSKNALESEASSRLLVFDRNRPVFACLETLACRTPASERSGFPPDFAARLAPLLITVGTEVAGSNDTLSLEHAEAACCVAELLSVVVSPLRSSKKGDLGSKVASAFRHFPYEVNPASDNKTKGGKGRKSKDDEGARLKAASVAVKLNLNLVHVLAEFGVSGNLKKRIGDYVVGLLEDASFLGLCSSFEIRNAVTSVAGLKDEGETRGRILSVLSKATSGLHCLKKERLDLSEMLANFYEEAYRNESVDDELRAWAKSTVDLLEQDTVRPELFPLLVSLCKLGDKTLKSKMTKSLRLFCRGIESKALHRTTWSTVSTDLFHLFSWIRLELSPRDRSALLKSGCLTQAQLQCLKREKMAAIVAASGASAHGLKWLSPPEELKSLMRDFRAEFTSCDVTLICPNSSRGETPPVVFKAHKVVLNACSAFFKYVFREVLSEGGNSSEGTVLVMTDTRPEALRLLLDFVYNGQVRVDSGTLGSFMQLADKLQIEGMLTVLDGEPEKKKSVHTPNRRRSSGSTPADDSIPSKRFRTTSGPTSSQRPAEEEGVLGDVTMDESSTPGDNDMQPNVKDSEYAGLKNEINSSYGDGGTSEPAVLPADVNPDTIHRWCRDSRVFVGRNLSAGEDLYFCGVCDFQSSNAWRVQNHLMQHYPSRFMCQLCDESFSLVGQRRAHCAEVHGLLIDVVPY